MILHFSLFVLLFGLGWSLGYILGLRHGRSDETELLEKLADKIRLDVESAIQNASGVKLH